MKQLKKQRGNGQRMSVSSFVCGEYRKNIREKKMTKTGSCVIIYQKKQKEGRKRDADFDCRG